jgi:formylglycine-generating enzyme required for sulfatase activity
VIAKKEDERNAAYLRRIKDCFLILEPHCGILRREGKKKELKFIHLSFQEFLAAKYLISEGEDHPEFLKKVMNQEHWRSSIILLLSLMSLKQKKPCIKNLKYLLDEGSSDTKKDNHYLWILAAEALSDIIGRKKTNLGAYSNLVTDTRECLLKIIQTSSNIRDRYEAGKILGFLGDPRIAHPEMIKIPAGEFIRGSTEEDKEAYDREKPASTIYLDEFEISKYPVTNQEYEQFIKAGGYDKKEFWTSDGWDWIQKNQIKEPGFWRDRRFNMPNFPVVGVSWYEADAWCKWFGTLTGKSYRLPTEAEWEKAARGTDGRIYPWGNEIDPDKCNYGKSGLNNTSPIGIFPNGESPYGCLDMAGNVWEWCSDWYDGNYYKKKNSLDKNPMGPKEGGSRVLRGGSWIDFGRDVRSAARSWRGPDFRDDRTGFRFA